MFHGFLKAVMNLFVLICILPIIGAAYVSENPDTYCGHPGVPEYGDVRTPVSSQSRRMNMQSTFPPRTQVLYECKDKNRVLRGESIRWCGLDGRWTGTRPWCDTNVAYGRSVTYSGSNGNEQTSDMTDGLSTVDDSICPGVMKPSQSSAYLEVDLGAAYQVNYVNIYFKDTVTSLDGEKVSLVGVKDCGRLRSRAATFNTTYECLRPTEDVTPSNYRTNQRQSQGGTSVRFEHPYGYSVGVCEVEMFANPSRLECGQPEVPANGQITLTQMGSYQQVNYTCNEGYRLEGEGQRTCSGRSWRGQQPICVPVPYQVTEEPTIDVTLTLPTTAANGGGSNVVQILLIVLVVILAVGLIITFIVLVRQGRCNCCCRSRTQTTFNSFRKKKTISGSADYLAVKKDDAREESAAKRKTVSIEEDPEDLTPKYTHLQFSDRPKSQEFSAPTTEAPQIDGNKSEILYAQINKRQSAAPSSVIIPEAEMSLDSIETPKGSPYQAKNRKSYIPLIYQVETPANQSLGMVNAQLRDALKTKKMETTDDL